MWCPTRGVSIWPSETRHAQHEKCGWLKGGPKGARYARIAAGDLRPCPPPFSQPLCSAMSSLHRCCSSELKRRFVLIPRFTKIGKCIVNIYWLKIVPFLCPNRLSFAIDKQNRGVSKCCDFKK